MHICSLDNKIAYAGFLYACVYKLCFRIISDGWRGDFYVNLEHFSVAQNAPQDSQCDRIDFPL